ncbi:peptidylprolyl isomerase [Novosphingobium resinovorum]|jgi:peptidylprolyl isomerase|uniref:Peptidyl-prolyl cis-trans isomerase n=1 Tax=Novosphingobium resinovorum TaxID=158500 RepID=A0A1D8A184_9SPHN|nr:MULTISPECIES: peptidylprolyl isomerase [Novosphingobium]AOR75901.1 peptidylprolyl isomerase [Novosphingobium resinovorum]MBF7011273.1 peptidylprolyl isomerase [Novosphingobium sp. HR1a]WJM29255.1 peptidylprolyl isomerase [Novosphingobium resinovorum]
MKFRLPLTALMLGAALVAAPAIAKDKDKKDEAAATPTPPPLPTTIDTDITHEPENVLLLDLSDGGRVAIRMMPQWAPHHVERVKTLAAQGFYNGQIFHRVIDGFMAQTGDPTGTGQGGSQLPDLQAEFNTMPHLRGTVSMARTNDPNSANSQFFIVFYPRFALDKKYTVFGRVISGMQYVDAIHRGEPPEDPTKIVQASLASENKPAPAAPVAPAAPALKAPSISDLNNSKSN